MEADPQDTHSEEALLGAALLSPASTKPIRLEAEEFYSEKNGLIWSAATKCAHNGGADAVTVAAELERRNQLKKVGGRERLAALAASVPAPGNAKAYAKRVKETAELRHYRRIATALIVAVENQEKDAIARALDELNQRVIYIDTSSGEMVETCPNCLANEKIIGKMEHKHRGLLSQISELEGRAEKKARQHPLWDEVAAIFDIYKLATAHFGITFTMEQFNQALPRWKQEGKGRRNPCKGALRAVTGIAYDPTTTKGRSGKPRRYDSWELLTRTQEKWEDFKNRVPGETDADWWRCLMTMIEANLKTKGTA